MRSVLTCVVVLAALSIAVPRPLQAQSSQSRAEFRRTVVRNTILRSRHLGAHGMGYSNRSLDELSRSLSPADVPILVALLADQAIRVGAQFALASQCQASIAPVTEAAKLHEMEFIDASDVMDLIAGFQGCSSGARAKAQAMRGEIDDLRKNYNAEAAEAAKRKAENDPSIQENSLKMMDPKRARELTREEREAVYRSALKAMGLDEKEPLTPAQKKIADRMYRTMVLGETDPSSH